MKSYPVKCFKCDKKMSRTHFDIVIGATAFFLCPKHLLEAVKYFKI